MASEKPLTGAEILAPMCPCKFCGGTKLKLLGNPVADMLGLSAANVYCTNCQAQAPQATWNRVPPTNPRKGYAEMRTPRTTKAIFKTDESKCRIEDSATITKGCGCAFGNCRKGFIF